MFGKKCPRCERKISKDFDFCPHCGMDFRIEKKIEKERDFGMLGEEDSNFSDLGIRMPLGFNTLFNSLLKQIDKEFREMDKQMIKDESIKKIKPNSGISISISTSTGKQPEIKVRGFGPEFKDIEEVKEARIQVPEISDEKAKEFSKLPKKEAETKVRRLSNKIIYEVDLPGVKNLKDIIINKLENSIEIKAFSKNTAYFKLIPLNLPILNYKLKDEKLILELKP